MYIINLDVYKDDSVYNPLYIDSVYNPLYSNNPSYTYNQSLCFNIPHTPIIPYTRSFTLTSVPLSLYWLHFVIPPHDPLPMIPFPFLLREREIKKNIITICTPSYSHVPPVPLQGSSYSSSLQYLYYPHQSL